MDDMENIELIKQMSQRLERIEKRQRRARWWKAIVWCCVLAVLAGLVYHAGPKVMATVKRYEAAMEKIEKVSDTLDGIDAEKLKESLNFLGSVDYDKLKERADELGKLTDQIEKLDLESLADEIAELKTSIEPVLKFLK